MLSAGRGARIAALLKLKKEEEMSSSIQKNNDVSDDNVITAMECVRIDKVDLNNGSEETNKVFGNNKTIDLYSNHVCLEIVKKNPIIYQYHATFTPDITNRFLRMKLVVPRINRPSAVFNGTIAYVYGTELEVTEFTVDDPCVNVSLKLVKTLNDYPASMLGTIFRKIMQELNLCLSKNNFYNPHEAVHLTEHHLDVWPGFITAINYYGDKLFLKIDSTSRILSTLTCYDILIEMKRNYGESSFQKHFLSYIAHAVVLTKYNNKTYTIHDVAWDLNVKCKFKLEDGNEISFEKYYLKYHGVSIKDLNQPLLVTRKNFKRISRNSEVDSFIMLVPELCYLTGLSNDARKNYKIMKDLASITCLSPEKRIKVINGFLEKVCNSNSINKYLSEWGLRLSNKFFKVKGQILPDESVRFKGGSVSGCHDWSREVITHNVLQAVPVTSWAVVTPRSLCSQVRFFKETVQEQATHLGLSFSHPMTLEIAEDKISYYVKCLREILGDGGRLQLVVIIFPVMRADFYSAVKQICCIECPVASQVINARTLANPMKSKNIVKRILLQINCKVGGGLWSVHIPISGLMIIGIDSFHSHISDVYSVGGFVASMDADCTKWYSRVCLQACGQEFVDGLKNCFVEALKQYHSRNHSLPDKIVIYRDGVGDGNFAVVKEYEMEQLLSCFSAFSLYEPKITIVIVHKRIHTRLFDDRRNPCVGTVVDHEITRLDSEFLLVSHSVNQGTVNPTRYIVTYNTNKLTLQKIQRLTYKLTFMYYNWPGTVRVPAPCLYAHKLALLVGQSLRKEPSPQLSRQLFYL